MDSRARLSPRKNLRRLGDRKRTETYISRIPIELWEMILAHAMHVPLLKDVDPPDPSEYPAVVRVGSLIVDGFPGEQMVKDAVSVAAATVLVCKAFYRAFIPFLYECILVTAGNSWLVSRALRYSASSKSAWLRPHCLSFGGRTQRLVVSLSATTGNASSTHDLTTAADLDTIARHVPNLRILIIDVPGGVYAPWLQDVFIRVLPTSRLKKVAFHGRALSMFGSELDRFLASAPALQTLICATDPPLSTPGRLPLRVHLSELSNLAFLSCDITVISAGELFQASPSLTRVHLKLSQDEADVELTSLWGKQGPYVEQLLISIPRALTEPDIIFSSLTRTFPIVSHLTISSSLSFFMDALMLRSVPATVKTLVFVPIESRISVLQVRQLFEALVVAVHPTLCRIRIVDKSFIEQMVEYAATGDDIGLTQLKSCSFKVEDWLGRALKDIAFL